MTYKIEVRETLSEIVEIEASTPAEAMNEARRMYQDEEIILTVDNFVAVSLDFFQE